MISIYDPIPNSPFYTSRSNSVSTNQGNLIVGAGLAVDIYGNLLVASALGGTVSQVTAGVGLSAIGGAPGGTITTVGTLQVIPPTGGNIGGVKAGANVTIAADGTISVAAPGTGTITGVTVGSGLAGGGGAGNVFINLLTASTTTLGGVVVGSGINVVGGLISLASATTLAAGGAPLATSAEVIAGTNATKIVTPSTLATKVASTTAQGLVQLSDVVATNSTLAATPTAVKIAYDAAVAAQATATAALPKSGGVMTGNITFAATQTFPGVSFPVATSTTPGVIIPSTGLSVTPGGYVTTVNNGTVTSIVPGAGLGAPATGNAITTTGTIQLLPPTVDGLSLGGVKQGTNITIGADGTISAAGLLLTNNQYAFNSYIWPIPNALPAAPFPGTNGQVLTVINNTTGQIGWTSTGTLTSVAAGTGLTAATTGGISTVGLANVPSITAGSYGSTAIIPTFSVNAQGQIISTGQANPYPPFQTATVAAPPNLVLDFTTNNTNWTYTLNGNLTISNPINTQPGQRGGMQLIQNPITPFAISWGSSWKFEGASPPVISTVAGAVDYFEFVVVSSNYIIVTLYLQGIG